ncbi:MAG: type II toxin-antitoxin system RelE/ParE family toxin [Oscillospiraceae bacterium]|jgi:plasmid stabilization system protein ParE|nr:type II toxin-antitoxin system RelE/ParE family toxin [Oscillospiraceae bacterium]
MYSLKYLPSAEQDLLDIVTYIAVDLLNPKAAEDLVDLYDHKMELLCEGVWRGQPLRGRLPERIREYGYHWVAVNNYLVFYTYDEDNMRILIHHICYGKRDLSKLL